MSFRGYRGGRITCQCGGTSIWLYEQIQQPVVVFQRDRRGHRETREIECERCHQLTPTRGSNTRRCPPCRDAVKLENARASSRRHVQRKRDAA